MMVWRLKRPIHVSWQIAVLSLAILAGVVAAQGWNEWFGSISWLIVGIVLAAGALWRSRLYGLPVILMAGGLIGLWRGSIDQQQLTPYRQLIGHQVKVTGIVSEDADVGKNGELLLRLSDIKIDNHPLSGKVWVSASTKQAITRSDRVTVSGKLQAGFGTFAAAIYRAKMGLVKQSQPGDVALRLRDGFADKVRTAVPEPAASLGLGYLLGQRRALPPDLDKALTAAGLTHIVVASGYNVTILVRLTRRLFVRISKYLAAACGVAMIAGFIAVTGNSPSMSRAGLVAGLSLLAWYYGRRFHPLVLLPFAAAVTLLINPSFGWNDLGWQLSFAAFAGVMIVAPLLQAFFFGDKKPGTVRQILGETIAAWLITLPILLVAFGQVSNVAIIANLLILPLVPLAMLLVFVVGLAVMIVPSIAQLVGDVTSGLLQYMIAVAEYTAGLEWAQTTLSMSGLWAGGYYVVLLCACGFLWYKTRFDFRGSNLVE